MSVKKKSQKPIVTKEWLANKVKHNPRFTIGRALVAIFRLQTENEKDSNVTKFHNGVGFSSNDARLGCIGAKYFIKHNTLTDGLMKGWLKLGKDGLPRITRYARQLNKIAIHKQANLQPNEPTND
jgi:hypothetical protein